MENEKVKEAIFKKKKKGSWNVKRSVWQELQFLNGIRHIVKVTGEQRTEESARWGVE